MIWQEISGSQYEIEIHFWHAPDRDGDNHTIFRIGNDYKLAWEIYLHVAEIISETTFAYAVDIVERTVETTTSRVEVKGNKCYAPPSRQRPA